jgi:hypothetical protein
LPRDFVHRDPALYTSTKAHLLTLTNNCHNNAKMSSAPPAKNHQIDARAPVTPEEMSQALAVEVFDREGKTTTLGELVKGKRTALVFIRHFCKTINATYFDATQVLTRPGCVNCHGYVRYLSASMPPSSLPQNTQRKSGSTKHPSRNSYPKFSSSAAAPTSPSTPSSPHPHQNTPSTLTRRTGCTPSSSLYGRCRKAKPASKRRTI